MTRANNTERLEAMESGMAKQAEALEAIQIMLAMGSPAEPVDLVDRYDQPFKHAAPIVIRQDATPAQPKTDWVPMLTAIAGAVLPPLMARMTQPPPDPMVQLSAMMEMMRDMQEGQEEAFSMKDLPTMLAAAKDLFPKAAPAAAAAAPGLGGLDLGQIADALGVDKANLHQLLSRKIGGDGATSAS